MHGKKVLVEGGKEYAKGSKDLELQGVEVHLAAR